jgi:hypothetical protein
LQAHEDSLKAKDEFMQVDAGAGDEANKREVRFESLYDVLFNSSGKPKPEASQHQRVLISGANLDFLEQGGSNVSFVEALGGGKVVEVDKLKISKQFKLVNPVPKFLSVPANP